MFHKKILKNLEELSVDRGLQVWYDIHVGRLLEAVFFLPGKEKLTEKGRHFYFMETFLFFSSSIEIISQVL